MIMKWVMATAIAMMVVPAHAGDELFLSTSENKGVRALIAPAIPDVSDEMRAINILVPVKTIEVYDPQSGKRIEVDVLGIPAETLRGRLTNTETLVTIEKRDSTGKLTYVGSGGAHQKGSYRITFDYVNYAVQEISSGGKVKLGKIGVGLRVVAEITTTANGVSLNGLLPIGIAVENKRASGQLRFQAFGISNDKLALTVPGTSDLSVESIQKAFEAAAAARVLFGLDESKLEPHVFAMVKQ